jgi:hypothetical protein
MQIQFEKFLSTDSPKAIKASGYGYLNGINYMAPHKLGGVGNLCPHASAGCISLCLGDHSGQAAMSQKVKESRKRKARYFMKNRAEYMAEFALHIRKTIKKAVKIGLKPAIRPNGSTDIAYEGIPVTLEGLIYKNIMEAFPEAPFLDYTKNPKRFDRPLPANYHLTFSLSETNEKDARALLARGFNVAVVFGSGLPKTYLGYPVIDGDKHDLRFLDPKGVIVGLSPKGNRAKRDESGFVIRNYSTHNA